MDDNNNPAGIDDGGNNKNNLEYEISQNQTKKAMKA